MKGIYKTEKNNNMSPKAKKTKKYLYEDWTWTLSDNFDKRLWNNFPNFKNWFVIGLKII